MFTIIQQIMFCQKSISSYRYRPGTLQDLAFDLFSKSILIECHIQRSLD